MSNFKILNFIFVLNILVLIHLPNNEARNVSNNQRILEGEPADKELWSFIIALSTGKVQHCGGSLIRPKWVLTAAHCVSGKAIEHQKNCFGELHVRPGPDDLLYSKTYRNTLPQCPENIVKNIINRDLKCSLINPRHAYQVKEVFINPNSYMVKFKFSAFIGSDIALLKLNDTVKGFEPISLPKRPIYQLRNCFTAGWGKKSKNTNYKPEGDVNILQQISVRPLPKDECFDLLENAFHPTMNDTLKNDFRKNIFCADGVKKNSGIFTGDSGGPLICNNRLQGITSLHIQIPTDNNIVGVFAETICYIDWINEVLVKNGEEPLPTVNTTYRCFSAADSRHFDKICLFAILFIHILKDQ